MHYSLNHTKPYRASRRFAAILLAPKLWVSWLKLIPTVSTTRHRCLPRLKRVVLAIKRFCFTTQPPARVAHHYCCTVPFVCDSVRSTYAALSHTRVLQLT
ncbi:hypothetical protein L1987_54498 [Smallanthus sonchifolius]|uniref:Uncharacterized protein n=1 Tax=Smallanthus sonchifolius TaxID=185202 RepID=A0ACB9E764_9ASTR|nr:hypothetical protein L1987_54498 [Smallanthus sonchifolius]